MLNIKNAQAENAVRELAERLNCSLTDAVQIAVNEKLRQLTAHNGNYIEQVRAAARRVTELCPTDGFMTDEELYDDHGLPR